jgi:hypothetical protein
MAEKSKEKKRSGNATLIATALALMVGGTALWSINQSISDSDIAGTGEFAAESQAIPTQSDAPKVKPNMPEIQATLDIPAPPEQTAVPDVYRVPPLAQGPIDVLSAPLRLTDEPGGDLAAADSKPEMDAQDRTTAEAESLASVATASGATDMTAVDIHKEVVSTEPDDAGTLVDPVAAVDADLVPGASYYIAIGSYIHRGNALLVKQERKDWQPIIREATVEGRNFYRLLVGPFSFKDLGPARTRMRAAGVVGEWPVRADSETDRADLALLD